VRPQCVIIEAGPAGLTAAYELSENGADVVVLEQDRIVGGIARTVEHKGYRFDIGGHRFFSKVPLINERWTKILGEMLTAIYAARNIFGGDFNVWEVNIEEDYHEATGESATTSDRLVPQHKPIT
jgi:phytoene dehydrogenase-like protein